MHRPPNATVFMKRTPKIKETFNRSPLTGRIGKEMETETIAVQKREKIGSRASKALRKEGLIPGILYGHGVETVHFSIPAKSMEQCLLRHVRVMKVDMGGDLEHAMLKDLQWDVFGDEILHVDLLRIRMDEVVSMNVALETSGRAKGCEEGGILDTQRNEIRVKCLPSSIPEVITFDISGLGIGDSLHIRDIQLPEGVECDDDLEQVVVLVAAKVEVVEVAEAPEEGEEGEAPADEEQADEEKKDKKGDA